MHESDAGGRRCGQGRKTDEQIDADGTLRIELEYRDQQRQAKLGDAAR